MGKVKIGAAPGVEGSGHDAFESLKLLRFFVIALMKFSPPDIVDPFAVMLPQLSGRKILPLRNEGVAGEGS